MKKNYKEFDAEEYQISTWYNPTQDSVTVRVWRGPETSANPWLYMTIPPGEERNFPSEYDSAIHTLDKNGIIVGGKAPQIKKKGAVYKLNPALDSKLAERQAALHAATQALADKAVAEQSAILAVASIRAAEEAREAERQLEEKLAAEKNSRRKKTSDLDQE